MLMEVNPVNPEPRKIRRAVEVLQEGGVIAYPTDTVYGLGCDLFNKKAIDRLYQIKGMSRSQQLAFVCSDLAQVAKYAIVNDYEYRILKEYLPGPYCFILRTSKEVPKVVQTARKHVGVRIPNHPVALAMVQELGHPVISSTAARAGQPVHIDAKELDLEFKGLDLVIDGGAGGEVPTTVIDLTADRPVIVREGAGDPEPFR
ncbi:MAG TPA: L-threonylcarbamoyladenylate synthase [Polyangiaceae bacterium]|jgi:tRNA threonylcarbamoyl adenosine modification protein (Sua5/YciO/YrdC/YwlC family)|nr:L-threonylcarbamoyladenylate synthase [Polyangiaceae bacterium]